MKTQAEAIVTQTAFLIPFKQDCYFMLIPVGAVPSPPKPWQGHKAYLAGM